MPSLNPSVRHYTHLKTNCVLSISGSSTWILLLLLFTLDRGRITCQIHRHCWIIFPLFFAINTLKTKLILINVNRCTYMSLFFVFVLNHSCRSTCSFHMYQRSELFKSLNQQGHFLFCDIIADKPTAIIKTLEILLPKIFYANNVL